MKQAFAGVLVVVLIMCCSFHFSVIYLNFTRTIGMDFTAGVNILHHSNFMAAHKAILIARGQ
jgi:hypothetical protein